jgi:Cof subfamily protein (haloacid dehalogenase superfamily)
MIGAVTNFDLIALDLDGTLLNSRDEVSPRNRLAIRSALEAGVRVVLVTGRGIDLPSRIAHELELNLPVICAHGALTKDFLSARVFGHIPVPLRYAKPMLEFAEREHLSAAVYLDECFYRLEGSAVYMEDMRGPGWGEIASFNDVLRTAPTFIRFLGHDAVEAMRGAFGDFPLHFKYESWGAFEECAVTSRDATKENALANLCKQFNIRSERVIAIGDSRNDIPMLRWAGLGIAMANALPEVRQAIATHTASNNDDGVALAIERFVLAPNEQKSA